MPSSESAKVQKGLGHAIARAALELDLGLLVSAPDASGADRYRMVNDTACALLGASSEQLVGRSVEATFLGNAYFNADEIADATGGTDLRELRGELIRRDGQRVPIRWIRVVTRVGGQAYTVHILTRAERRSRAEQALLDSEQRFRRLIDAAPDAMLILTTDRITYANQAMTQLSGYSNPRQLSQLTLHHLFCSDDADRLMASIGDLDNDEGPLGPFELRAMRRDGRSVLVEAILVPTEWDTGRGVMLLARDLSGRRELQGQMVQTDRLAAVGTLAAGVAHEINNPLAYVLLNLQYLLREVPKLSEDSGRLAHLVERVREARHGAERVGAIVRDLKTFSRSDEEQVGPIELKRVLLSAIKVARTQLMSQGQIVEAFEEVPPVRANASRLEQVFLNLLINAIQALPSDDANRSRIHVRIWWERGTTDEGAVCIAIADTGAGIPEEHLDRVFDPFFTTKPVGLGTGLGLPICHSLVTQMGGTISVKSKLGEGTRFTVSLPAARPLERPVTRIPTPAPGILQRRAKILVVDDERAVASMLSRILGEEHDVQVATDATAALEILEREEFDLILCDLLMPHVTGMDLYAELAKRHPGREARVVFMTGGAFTPRAAQFLSKVDNARIEKPFDLMAIRKLVRELAARTAKVSQ